MDAIDLCSDDEDIECSIPLTEEIDFVGAIKADWGNHSHVNQQNQSIIENGNSAENSYKSEHGYISLFSDEESNHSDDRITQEHRIQKVTYSKSSSGVSSLSEDIITNKDVCLRIQDEFMDIQESINTKTTEKPLKKKICKAKSNEKEAKQREKVLKKAMSENHKSLKPKECMKYIYAEIGSELLNKPYCSRVLEVLHGAGAQHSNQAPPFSNSCIGWIRKCPRYLVTEDGQLTMSAESIREPQLLAVMDIQEVEELMKEKCFNSHIRFLKEASNCQVTLLIYGSKEYFRQQTNKNKAKWKNQVLGLSNGKGKNDDAKITENDFDYYVTKLLFEEATSCTKADTVEELAHIVMQFTKAVAETPFKLAKYEEDEKANFYMRGDNRECVRVDKDGNGLLRLWCQSLTKFPNAGLETAQAICEKYPSPASLITMLKSDSPAVVMKSLADMGVRRAGGPLAGTRRIGPQLAQKIFTFFTATRGDQLLV